MKRELKQAVSRIRKAQDAVFNHKVAGCHCMSVDCNTLIHEDGQAVTWWTIFCHKDSDPEHCRSWRLAEDEPEELAAALQQIGEYMNYQI